MRNTSRSIKVQVAIKDNGGDVVYISPGVKVNISHAQNVYANYSYPAYQKLGGISNDEKGRFSVGWGMSF